MRHPATSRTTTKKMSLDGSVYLVRLLEMSSKEIVYDSKGPLWPRFGSDPSPPKVDGVLVLHDTTQPAVFAEIANLLGVSTPLVCASEISLVQWLIDGSFCSLTDSVAASSLPFVVLASKSGAAQAPNGPRDPVLERYEIHRATPESPRSQKMCIALVLRSVINHKQDKNGEFSDSSNIWSPLHPTLYVPGGMAHACSFLLLPFFWGESVCNSSLLPASTAVRQLRLFS